MNLMDLPADFLGRLTSRLEMDFSHYTTAQNGFSSVLSDSGSIAVGDASPPYALISPSDSSVANNDEAYLKSTNEIYIFENNRPLVAEAILQHEELNVDDANIAFGFMSAVAADSLQDDGAGPQASFSGAIIYKVDGGAVWRCRSSIGASYTDSISTSANSAAAKQRLRIEVAVQNSVAEVTYWIGSVNALGSTAGSRPCLPLIDSTTNRPIKHRFSITSATEMNLFTGIKLGGDTNHDKIKLYRLCGAQTL